MTQTDFEKDMAELLVSALELEDVSSEEIDPEAPLFSHDAEGLGLDSIDALEIALAVKQRYGVQLQADDEQNTKIFASLRSLSEHVLAESRRA
jgi:acyl carrier protein